MNRMFVTGVATLAMMVSASAQVGARRENQQDRIANGVQSGQLTPGETTNLEDRRAAINGETRADRTANGGKLTPAERARINRQDNNLSRSIYRDKHNSAVSHYGNSEVGQRQRNQQDRIGQGIRSGSMNASEAARSENNARALNGEVRADRAANGGRLTKQEHAQVNRQLNRDSRQIYREKHN